MICSDCFCSPCECDDCDQEECVPQSCQPSECPAEDCACDASNETQASALENFILAFFGTVTKTCVDGRVVWILPCDLEAGLPALPRIAGEGIACYLLRLFNLVNGNTGYTITVLSNTNVNLTTGVSTVNQEFRGTLTADVDLDLLALNAGAGNHFELYLNNIDLDAFTLRIKSAGLTIKTFTGPGILSGFVQGTWTGTAWAPTKAVTDTV